MTRRIQNPTLIVWILLFLYFYAQSECATLNDTDTLYSHKIYSNNHRYRPVKNQSSPITISFSLELLFLENVDTVKETISLNLIASITWTDEIRTWNPSDYGGLTTIIPDPKDIWRPRFNLGNSVGDRDMFKDDYAPLIIDNDGTSIWSPGSVYVIGCSMKMTYFPFDSQTCELVIASNDFVEDVTLDIPRPFVGLSLFTQDGQWDVVDGGVFTFTLQTHASAVFEITLRRRSSFLVLNLILPIMGLSALSHVVFLTPIESGERISLSMTTMLSLSVYLSQLSSSLPRNSNSLPMLILYLIGVFIHCSATLVVNCVILMKFHAEERNKSISKPNDSTDHFSQRTQTPQITTESLRHVPAYSEILHTKSAVKSTPNAWTTPTSGNNVQKTSPKSVPEPSSPKSRSRPSVYLDYVIWKAAKSSPLVAIAACVRRLTAYVRPADLFFFCSSSLVWVLGSLVFLAILVAGE